ncbi:hypothetical protein Hanom_Chr02g00127171 [Helianthus anomalus]
MAECDGGCWFTTKQDEDTKMVCDSINPTEVQNRSEVWVCEFDSSTINTTDDCKQKSKCHRLRTRVRRGFC